MKSATLPVIPAQAGTHFSACLAPPSITADCQLLDIETPKAVAMAFAVSCEL